MRARTFNIMQYEQHPETGEKLIDEVQVRAGVSRKSIRQWAYICHDKDVFTVQDESNDLAGNRKAGDPKPRHWHIVARCENAVDTATIAKWFGVPENYVDVPKGAGAFLDCVEYLTHEGDRQQKLGKMLYQDSEVTANFNFRDEINKKIERQAKYGKALDAKAQMRYDVLYNGLTLREAIERDRFIYMEDMERLKRLRLDYISRQEPPIVRINYYVTGRGGVGKGLICRALARSLFPYKEDDSDIFFEVGAKGALFEGYDGQPVIIWNDRRAVDLLQELDGRANVFNVFDTHPTGQKQNVKYSSVRLCNTVNIVNSVEPFRDFLDGLAGEYTDKTGTVHKVEDKGQSYRRFPMITVLYEKDYDLLLNKGFLEGSKEFEQYVTYERIRGNMQKVVERCGANRSLSRKLERQMVAPIIKNHNLMVEQHMRKPDEEEVILREFKDLGTQASGDGFLPIKSEDVPFK
jgi:hypothetical protein